VTQTDANKCPRCGHQNPPRAKFCVECAAPLARACAACRADLPPGAKFCPECAHPVGAAAPAAAPAPARYTPRHLAERILDSRAALEGERKQVSVLFADLKGSMELLADRDPEEARRLLDPVLDRMMEAVHHYDGTVNQVMGDGIMALFGAPLAHEDHAVRACYAALRMQDAIRRYTEELRRTQGIEVLIRIGLNSGEVVVRSIGSDLRMDYTAVGQTTHLAARMEQLAAPGTIRLTGETLALAEGYVAVRPLGPIPVKGLAAPVEVYELTGASAVRTRLQAASGRGLTRFVGRDAEMGELTRAADEARRGRGQVVAVVGEPGVGKSRLFYEFTRSHHARGWLVLESGSVSYGKATPYLPLTDLLRAYFRIERSDDVRAVQAKVTGNVLTLDEALKDAIPAALWLLDALPEDGAFLNLDPGERRRRTLAAVKGLLLRESRVRPLALVFEDLHWIDSETQEFLDSLVDSLPAAPILLAVNYRPEYRHGWGSRTYYRQLRIDPLPPESADDLLEALLGDDPSVAALKPLLIARTEGNPLFLEESVRALVETGALAGTRGAYRFVKTPEAVTVPATVQAILAARIDRLAPEDKRLLQAAAVVGKDVPFALVLAIADLDEDGLRRGLGRLQAAEFLYEARLFPELEYTFKHALTHEVAYGSLLSDRRQALHAALVGAIERIHADRVEEHAERLAHHAVRGHLPERAVQYLQQAGERAVARSANPEAVALFEQALAALAELADTVETQGRRADVLLALGAILTGIKGAGSPDVEGAHRRARELAERLDDPVRLYRALWGLWYVNYGRGQYAAALELGEQLLAIAQRDRDTGRLLEAHHALWPTLCAMGDLLAALPHLEQGIALYDPAQHASQAPLYGDHDAGACARYHLARTQWFLGYPDRAAAVIRDAIGLAETLGHQMTLTITHSAAAFVYYQRGDWRAACASAERSQATARAHGFAAWINDGLAVQTCIAVREGAQRELGEIYDRLVAATTSSTAWRAVLNMILMAEAALALGDVERGLRALDAIPERHRDAIGATEIRRLHAEAMWLHGRPAEAERHFRDALAIARRRAERGLELRAATGLARLLAADGRRAEARRGLGDVYAWFTEGLDTVDLRAARALLDELGAPA
jgi:class 3 adenylate cyclase/tetratricopeptide (TPR) repeat protein